MSSLFSDLNFAFRSYLRKPGFALTAVLTLGLGIGVNSAIFSVVNAILIRPLPVAALNELVDIYTSGGFPDQNSYGTSSYADYTDLRDQSRSFQDIASHSLIFASQQNPVQDVMVNGAWVIQGGKHTQELSCADAFAKILEKTA